MLKTFVRAGLLQKVKRCHAPTLYVPCDQPGDRTDWHRDVVTHRRELALHDYNEGYHLLEGLL